jgi:inosine triphosphate pyrophosphatase
MKLYFVTGNKEKLKEARSILADFEIEQVEVDLPELQGEPDDIAKEKARIACEKTGKRIFIDDTSFCLNCLNGMPGPYIKDFLKKIGVDGVSDLALRYKDHSAYAQVCIGYCEPGKEAHVFKGRIDGRIVTPQGENGFQWDKIFVPDGYSQTFAQMSAEEKNKISHRKLAFEAFKKWLGHSPSK